MKLIVVDLDRLKYRKPKRKKNKRLDVVLNYNNLLVKSAYESLLKSLNAEKICTLKKKDFGKKVLLGLPKGDSACLVANKDYQDSIFHLKDDDDALKFENKMFRKLLKLGKIKYFRIGTVIRREKSVKILGRLLGIS